MKTKNQILSLTSFQKRLWFEWIKAPKRAMYNTMFKFLISGELNVKKLKQSLEKLTLNHEALRTIFKLENGEVNQVILPTTDINFSYIDLSKKDNDKEILILKESNNLLTKPFNLYKSPIYRYGVIKTDKNKFILCLSWHHIIVDGTSVKTLLSELEDLYNEKTKNEDQDLNLELPMHEIIQKENRIKKQEGYKVGLQYWSDFLKGSPLYVDFPKLSKNKKIEPNGERIYYRLDKLTSDGLLKIAAKYKTSLFTILTSILNVALYRYSKMDDILIAYSSNGRSRHQKHKVGFMVNSLPMRIKIDAKDSFSDVIKKVKSQKKESLIHQKCSFIDILKKLRTENKNVKKLPFNILVNQYTSQSFNLNLKGLTCSIQSDKQLDIDESYSLSLLFDYRKKVELEFMYDLNKHDTELIEQFIRSFNEIISEIIKSDDICVSTCSILKIQDRLGLIYLNNPKENRLQKSNNLYNAFLEQVSKTPDKTAISCENIQLSYRELNEKTHQYSLFLIDKHNISNGDVIGVCCDRSEKNIILILAILRLGAIYLPLDPDYPKNKIHTILENSKPRLVVSEPDKIHLLNTVEFEILNLENLEYIQNLHEQSTINPSNDTAFLLYTSGTTGVPKGVEITHKGMCNQLLYSINQFHLSKNEKVLYKSNIGFDASIFEIFIGLLSGSEIVVIPKKLNKDVFYLQKKIFEKKVTFALFVPSMLSVFLNYADLSKLFSLKSIMLGGESINTELYEKCIQISNKIKFYNLYGPAEASVYVSHWSLKPTKYKSVFPIGKPINNVTTMILDEYLNQVPIGVQGQLYIGGVCLSKGYYKNPRLNKEKFIIINNINKKIKMYATGDLARYLPDGNIDFLGRIDNQVKIRGCRVELGEIQRTLESMESIEQAIILSREIALQNEILAYYKSNVSIDTSIIRNYLKNLLPDYMIPKYFMQIDTVQLTPNGKIDLKSLPLPDFDKNKILKKKELPKTLLENQLVKIWGDLLSTNDFGIKDNFFDVGGDSLLLIKLQNEIASNLDIRVNITDLYEYPSIFLLAKHINSDESTEKIKNFDLNKIKNNTWNLEILLKEIGEN